MDFNFFPFWNESFSCDVILWLLICFIPENSNSLISKIESNLVFFLLYPKQSFLLLIYTIEMNLIKDNGSWTECAFSLRIHNLKLAHFDYVLLQFLSLCISLLLLQCLSGWIIIIYPNKLFLSTKLDSTYKHINKSI